MYLYYFFSYYFLVLCVFLTCLCFCIRLVPLRRLLPPLLGLPSSLLLGGDLDLDLDLDLDPGLGLRLRVCLCLELYVGLPLGLGLRGVRGLLCPCNIESNIASYSSIDLIPDILNGIIAAVLRSLSIPAFITI